jgi:hypothetical protein
MLISPCKDAAIQAIKKVTIRGIKELYLPGYKAV